MALKRPDTRELTLDDLIDVEAALADFEAKERARLGVDTIEHWTEPVHTTFTASQRAHTTILLGGLTMAQDVLIVGALSGLGYNVKALDVPDKAALRYGKEFGNRGQCNPTYFTVGNLVKFLSGLRDGGMPTEQIIDSYVFMTAGACGPCRFGMYVTEYRKALRDAGFDGFRVMLFQQTEGLKQATGEENGLVMNPAFFIGIVKGILLGDILNFLQYRIRPYEVEAGATDLAMTEAKRIAARALEEQTSLAVALWKIRKRFAAIEVDRLQPKPRVSFFGEFWAMTTEGDGNYDMQRFIEAEGGEVLPSSVTAWLLFMIWEGIRDSQHRFDLRKHDQGRKGLDGVDTRARLLKLYAGYGIVQGLFQGMANAVGLHGQTLPNMWENARVAGEYYNNDLRGGKGHLEVGKLIVNTLKKKATMTLSIKPFGCMPSSTISDGVQSKITEFFPDAIFLPIETTGDGAVNVYSRVQMALFRARKTAEDELADALERYEMTEDEARLWANRVPLAKHPLFKPPHHYTSAAADTAAWVGRLSYPLRKVQALLPARSHA